MFGLVHVILRQKSLLITLYTGNSLQVPIQVLPRAGIFYLPSI